MPRIVSLGTQIKQLAGLLDTADITEWEQDFIKSVYAWSRQGGNTSILTEKQIDIIERIYRRHFA